MRHDKKLPAVKLNKNEVCIVSYILILHYTDLHIFLKYTNLCCYIYMNIQNNKISYVFVHLLISTRKFSSYIVGFLLYNSLFYF